MLPNSWTSSAVLDVCKHNFWHSWKLDINNSVVGENRRAAAFSLCSLVRKCSKSDTGKYLAVTGAGRWWCVGLRSLGLDSLPGLSEQWTNSADCSCEILTKWPCRLVLWTEPWTLWSQKYNSGNLIPQIFLLQEWKKSFMVCINPPEMCLFWASYVTLCLLQSSHHTLLRVFYKSWGIEASFKESSLFTTALLVLMTCSGSPESQCLQWGAVLSPVVQNCCCKMLQGRTGPWACKLISVKHKFRLAVVIPMFKSGHAGVHHIWRKITNCGSKG